MSNALFISEINKSFANLLQAFPGSVAYGLAETVIRGAEDTPQFIPGEILPDGEVRYIGLDDIAPLSLYHKASTELIADKAGSGYGDSALYKLYTYNNIIVINFDTSITKQTPDQMLLLIEANLPQSMKVPSYKTATISTTGAILNTQQIFVQEYRGNTNRLPYTRKLMSISYKVEALFDKNCLNKCP
jgi:hypothetical protein